MAGLDLFNEETILPEEKKPKLQNDNFEFFTFNPDLINPEITNQDLPSENSEIVLNVQDKQPQPCSSPDFDK